MQNRKFTKTIILLSIFSLLLVGGVYVLYKDIENKNIRILSLNSELALLNTRQDYLKSTQDFIERSKSDLDKIDRSIVEKGKDVEFIEYVEGMARENNLSIEIESLGFVPDSDKSKVNGFQRLNARVKVSGSWSNVYKFLNLIESMPFKIRMSGANISGASSVDAEGKGGNLWTGTFDITVLEYK